LHADHLGGSGDGHRRRRPGARSEAEVGVGVNARRAIRGLRQASSRLPPCGVHHRTPRSVGPAGARLAPRLVRLGLYVIVGISVMALGGPAAAEEEPAPAAPPLVTGVAVRAPPGVDASAY